MARRLAARRKINDDAPAPARRRVSALAITIFVIIVLFAGLVSWLSLTYTPPEDVEPRLALSSASKDGGGTSPRPAAAAPAPVQAPTAATKNGNDLPPPAASQAESPSADDEKSELGPLAKTDAVATTQVATPPQVAAGTTPTGATVERATDPRNADGEAKPAAAMAPERPAADAAAAVKVEEGKVAAVTPPKAVAPARPQTPKLLPKAKGDQVWRQFARPFEAQAGTPRVAVLLWGLGLSTAATSSAIQQLPGEITLGLAPYGRNLQDWSDQARAAGHEVMLLLPMEPESYPSNDPGPHTLLTNLPIKENVQRLDWLLQRFNGYVGVTNYMGSRFTASEQDMRPILTALRDRGLMFLDSRASSNSVGAQIATNIGLARVFNNRFLDVEASRQSIDARLAELEQLAKAQGAAVGIGFPYPVTIERLARWAPTLERKGIKLAPVSAVVNVQKVQ